jgi:formylglycine-generating enzyme required for sulfatase activity
MSKNIDNVELNLLTDSAISNIEHDSLDFNVYSEVITEAILETPTPFTVGIFGEWGRGKTSLMKFIQKEVTKKNTKEERVLTVFFNAWRFENDEHPLLDLCIALELEIQRNRSSFEEDTVLNLLDYIKYLKYAIANIKMQKDVNTDTEFSDNLTIDIEKHLLNQSTYFQIFELLKGVEKILKNENFRIVIFIDDLDKCLPENSIKVLESIKLILDLKGLSFVLGVNREVIESHLENKYQNMKNISAEDSSRAYLDKMIQLPFYLPSYSGKVSNLIDNLYAQNSKDIKLENDIKAVLLSISSLEIVTPRFIVRLINRIKVNAKIYMKLNPKTTLSNERVLSLFSISCTLEELYKEFYTTLVKNEKVVIYLIKIIQNETFINEDTHLYLDVDKAQKSLILNALEENYNAFRMIFSTEQGKFWLENKGYRLDTFEFLTSSTVIETIKKDQDTHVYKTNFEDTVVLTDDKDINEKEFIKIPKQNYEMSKYVVTNKWFNEFINSNGYNEAKYWIDIAAKVWLMNNGINSLDDKYSKMIEKEKNYYKKKFKEDLKKDDFNNDLQPVVYVTYFEAQAFCNYLTQKDSEYIYAIPSREQWDYVAKGAQENKSYPWGNKWNNNYCNNATNQLHRTSSIGMFSQGDSTFGISDMVGNVWSWTSSLENNEYNYLKGGSWNFSDPTYFKVTDNQMTFFNNPSFQNYDIGFFCIRRKK